MDIFDGLNHLLNFVAPALFLALGLMLSARIMGMKSPPGLAWWVQAAITFLVGCLVLALGLWFFGRDGKMATYALLVLSSGLCQWLVSRAWRSL